MTAAPPGNASHAAEPNPPRSAAAEPLPYDLVGGEKGLRNLVETFYDIIEREPEGRVLHVLHLRGHGVAHSRIEQFNFLSGFFAGPSLYVQKHGHSDVRQMHEHVEIDAEAKDAWLNCMAIAIDRVGLPADIKARLMAPFARVATLLVNQK
ncbi:MAG: group II truncated hemoglobin [Hyphomicrobium sp.]|uniref:group II truncated hemoglobin n=1 Tax=Hyphomicrobium sp. TaxID=82 RepID=UPI0013249187|nr:group II truncated hemoglobin [Hyphomicrobium sp.]KAB2942331.1 MAG: group II truncated hemoglobin [Hyphomicrobium sp.]MBZ0209222.1 group II truncated hemoglobin [Hyphomicrobium sp.]